MVGLSGTTHLFSRSSTASNHKKNTFRMTFQREEARNEHFNHIKLNSYLNIEKIDGSWIVVQFHFEAKVKKSISYFFICLSRIEIEVQFGIFSE